MKCLLCNVACEPYFTKDFAGDCCLHVCEYVKCPDCGTVFCSTMCELPDDQWRAMQDGLLKDKAVGTFHPRDYGWYPRIVTQAKCIAALYEHGWISNGPAVDYGAGTGMLSDELRNRSVYINCYDPYYSKEGWLKSIAPRSFQLVTCSAVLEHLRSIADVRAIFDAPSLDGGVLMLHMQLSDTVPCDPKWYYLLPGHLAMWTLEAVRRLTAEHDYVQHVYHGPSSTWFFKRGKTAPFNIPGAWRVGNI